MAEGGREEVERERGRGRVTEGGKEGEEDHVSVCFE